MNDNTLLDGIIELSLRAGEKICAIYNTDFNVETKTDGSAVTLADKEAEAIILAGLKELAGDIPVIAEEAASDGHIPDIQDQFFLVDPLDGTREFVNRTGEFTVNIALIRNGRPVLGVVYAPGSNKLYFGSHAEGAFLQIVAPGNKREKAPAPQAIRARDIDPENLIAVASRSHRSPETEALLQKLGVKDFTPAGSSLKFCLIAEGLSDVYPRLGRTMEWDTAAGQAVLEAAGGEVNVLNDDEEGEVLLYGKTAREYDNPHFIAWGNRQT